MAFVCRTTRDENRVGFSSQASSSLGPGSYEIAGVGGIRKARPGFAAFGSTSGRGNLGDEANFVTPGPGSYGWGSSRSLRKEAASSNAFRSNTIRFPQKKSTMTPGPGEYTPKSSFKKVQERKRHPPTTVAAEPSMTAPVTWVRVASAPSIPAPAQSYGYEEGDHGELIMQKPPSLGHSGKAGDVVGPGEYSLGSSIETKKGVDWARSRSTRTDFTKNTGAGPSPADYDTTGSARNNIMQLEPRPTASFASKVERVKTVKSKHAMPGPGHYGAPRTGNFEPKRVPESMQFFGSTSRRFGSMGRNGQTPGPGGPGAYDVMRTSSFAGDAASRSRAARSSRHRSSVGFASTSTRFGGGITAGESQFSPAPGVYEMPSMVDEVKKKMSSRTGVFGSTTRRFATFGTGDNDAAPGPGAYSVARPIVSREGNDGASTRRGGTITGRRRGRKGRSATSAFASQTDRSSSTKAKQVPPPGAYDVSSSWSMKALRSGGGKGVMGSGSQRFKARDALVDAGGPGAYYKPTPFVRAQPNPKKVMVSTETRFKEQKAANVPGPGAYDSEYLYGNLNKRTFNMTIAEQEAMA